MNLCKEPGCDRPVENPEIGLCSTHSRLARKNQSKELKPRAKIKPLSDKKMAQVNEYTRRKKEFFKKPENKFCRVCGQPTASEIHHKYGKTSYYDDWARENGITLLNDVRFFIPVCPSWMINEEYGTSCPFGS